MAKRDVQLYCSLDNVSDIFQFLRYSNVLKNLEDDHWITDYDSACQVLFNDFVMITFSDIQAKREHSIPCPDFVNGWAKTNITRDGWKKIKKSFARYKYNTANKIFKIDVRDDTRLKLLKIKDELGFASYDEAFNYVLSEQQHREAEESDAITIHPVTSDETNSYYITDEIVAAHVLNRLPNEYKEAFKTVFQHVFCEGYLQAKNDKQRSVRKMQEHLETNKYLKDLLLSDS